MKMLNIESSE